MNILIQIAGFAGIAMLVYALYGMLFSAESSPESRVKRKPSVPPQEPNLFLTEEKIRDLETQIRALREELDKAKTDYLNLQKDFEVGEEKEVRLQEELARRQDWVAKSEEMLNKAKEESAEFKNKFMEKEKELEEGFSKQVDLNKKLNEANLKIKSLEQEDKEKTDQIQAQKHQLERLTLDVKTHLDTIAELKRKEEISEWVPKEDFHKLNEEYTELEKELERKEEKLKNLVEELIRLKQQLSEKHHFEDTIGEDQASS